MLNLVVLIFFLNEEKIKLIIIFICKEILFRKVNGVYDNDVC